ncbi:hypothetical protein NKI77_32700 [Mesorhizobium opportunistum]|uniref:Transmembrane protein n=1 Tax=Mesorhizobium opportunistum TaxID=593909 RepID=A0ABV1YR35_9HYPH|nr:hypothetical protein [Mesorhizobium sp.]TIN96863.1 MAG: hypothetical protein E5Y06_07795 [Mesorhizobium sp.]TJV00740.1 MAG: hypothetical protein E5Y08_05350 [Mesorhizobium sp.]TJV15527.1 MAG: hypothetical protein E5Y07_21195 [Mesorhizobium sp.]TJV43285.1 MAG: hypothetical protein E5Y02_11310 [Mesorhizobium sp.]
MNAKHHMLAVAVIFFVTGAIGIISSIALLMFGQSPNIVSAISSVAYVIGAYYFLKGSRPAKIFLAAMAGLATLLEGVLGIAVVAYGQMAFGLLILLLAALTAYCFCMLQFSKALNAEFDRRSEAYRLKKEKAARRFYEELEQGGSRE